MFEHLCKDVMKALSWLKENNKHYQDKDIDEAWESEIEKRNKHILA